jgi:hypothetical protein
MTGLQKKSVGTCNTNCYKKEYTKTEKRKYIERLKMKVNILRGPKIYLTQNILYQQNKSRYFTYIKYKLKEHKT